MAASVAALESRDGPSDIGREDELGRMKGSIAKFCEVGGADGAGTASDTEGVRSMKLLGTLGLVLAKLLGTLELVFIYTIVEGNGVGRLE